MPAIIHKLHTLTGAALRGNPPKPYYAYTSVCGQNITLATKLQLGRAVNLGQGGPGVHCAKCFKDDVHLPPGHAEPQAAEVRLPEDGALSGSEFYDEKGRPAIAT